MSPFIPFAILFAAMIAWAVHGIVAKGKLWDRSLEQAKALLESPELADRGTVKGKLAGHDVVIELTTRGSGSNAEAWTEIRVVHREVPMSLALRPQTLVETAVVALSKAVDVQIDDEAMDRAFVIDGAPADAVRRVLDDTTLRRQLLSLRPVEVEEKGPALQIAKKGWMAESQLETMLMAIVGLTTRMESLAETKDSPYRDADRMAHVKAELDALALARARRLRLRQTLVLTLVGIFVLVCVAVAVAKH